MIHFFKHVIAPALILLAAGAAAYTLYLQRPQPETAVIEYPPLLVDVAEVDKQDIRITVPSQGTVTPRTQTTLIAEVSGAIVSVSEQFEAGGFFNAGDMLLQIDDRNYRAAVKRAEAAVASARSALALERGRARVAYRDWQKHASQHKRDPEADALAQRRPQLDEAQAQLDSALADLARARDDLERTTIRAPYDGMLREAKVDIGQYVAAGSILGSAFAVDAVEVRLPIPDDRLSYLSLPAPGSSGSSPVQLSAQMGSERYQWSAQLVRSEGVLDERSRVLFVVARVDDPYGRKQPQAMPLRVGSFVKADIIGREFRDLVVLPRHVLRTGNRVWVVDEHDRLINREVKLLRSDGELAYIYAGLEDGERVCLSTVPQAVAGTAIRSNSLTKTSALLPSANGSGRLAGTASEAPRG